MSPQKSCDAGSLEAAIHRYADQWQKARRGEIQDPCLSDGQIMNSIRKRMCEALDALAAHYPDETGQPSCLQLAVPAIMPEDFFAQRASILEEAKILIKKLRKEPSVSRCQLARLEMAYNAENIPQLRQQMKALRQPHAVGISRRYATYR